MLPKFCLNCFLLNPVVQIYPLFDKCHSRLFLVISRRRLLVVRDLDLRRIAFLRRRFWRLLVAILRRGSDRQADRHRYCK